MPAIQHGKKNGKTAVQAYIEFDAKKSAETLVVVCACGLALHLQYRYLGSSPDGLVFGERCTPRFAL